jgi:hypothetical protein
MFNKNVCWSPRTKTTMPVQPRLYQTVGKKLVIPAHVGKWQDKTVRFSKRLQFEAAAPPPLERISSQATKNE